MNPSRKLVRFSWSVCLLLSFLLLPPLASAAAQPSADLGPKPEMNFDFVYEYDPGGIISGVMLECDLEDCSDGEELMEAGPQRFECDGRDCYSMAYGYADYHQLIIEYADGTRVSNVFKTAGFVSDYTVTVSEDGLEVKKTGGTFNFRKLCCGGFIFTMVIETLLAMFYLGAFGLPKAVLGWIPLASLITLPAVWWLFPLLPVSSTWVTALSEAFAFGVEAVFLGLVAGRTIGWRHAFVLAFLMNVVSFGGWFIL